MGYASNIQSMLDELVLRLKEITSLQNRVYKGYRVKITNYPTILVHFYEDNPEEIRITQRYHKVLFRIVLKDRVSVAENSETQTSNWITRIGEVMDKLDEYITNPPKWDRLQIGRSRFTFGQEGTFIIYSALIPITLYKSF